MRDSGVCTIACHADAVTVVEGAGAVGDLVLGAAVFWVLIIMFGPDLDWIGDV